MKLDLFSSGADPAALSSNKIPAFMNVKRGINVFGMAIDNDNNAQDLVRMAIKVNRRLTCHLKSLSLSSSQEFNFDPDAPIRESDGLRPIHYAVYKRAQEVIKVLMQRGADINARDKDGKTAGIENNV